MSIRKSLYGILFLLGSASALLTLPAYARHGDASVLPNRIPEPAAYVTQTDAKTGVISGEGGYNPPFPWDNNDNNSGRCNGCHTVIFSHWNGAMMSNAWRDPGWRGAFLLVARLTSTDGCADIPLKRDPVTGAGVAPDGTQGYDCVTPNPNKGGKPYKINPFANANNTSTFKLGGTTTWQTKGSGSLTDDFCSRCHMPTDYTDATVKVSKDTPSGLEHGDISPTFDPTEIDAKQATLVDPAYSGGYPNAVAPVGVAAKNHPYESYATRLTAEGRPVNSNAGKSGIICESCHTNVESRLTPYNNYARYSNDYKIGDNTVEEYYPVTSTALRINALSASQQDMVKVPNAASPNLGYAIGAGAFRHSGHAIHNKERFGPIAANSISPSTDTYLTQVFDTTVTYNVIQATGTHDKFYQVKFERSEYCAGCHDVTNPLTIKNEYGYWAGGFPIERTFTEWLKSRYAKRVGSPANSYTANNPYERDCQSCHMQQTFGEPGTALTLFSNTGVSDPPMSGPSHDSIDRKPHWTHHFVGGNAYMTKLIGADVNGSGIVQTYPELLNTSFSSANPKSRFHYARFTKAGIKDGNMTVGEGQTQHERFAWDRLRNAVTMKLAINGTGTVASISKPASGETLVPVDITVTNDGAGHNFPTGFPEGRAGWVKITAWDTRGGTVDDPYSTPDAELPIETTLKTLDGRTLVSRSFGVGYLTKDYQARDPNYALSCDPHASAIEVPGGSIDPYAVAFKAVATLDKKCPTLDLPYATAVNLKTNANGEPVDAAGNVVDRNNPFRKPAFTDVDGDGDLFDDSFLTDTRLRPMDGKTNTGATATIKAGGNAGKSYNIVVPASLNGKPIQGPIAVAATTYYQSFEAAVARKFLGNLANTDDDDDNALEGPHLEPCVLKADCDRIDASGTVTKRATEVREALKFDPIVIEGAPPVPMEVANAVINFGADNAAPRLIINNSSASTNMTAPVPANRHWSPSPYGGPKGYFAPSTGGDMVGETLVDHRRIVKVTFSEPVKGVNPSTFYLTDTQGRVVPAHLDQIDDTTWALFPYEFEDQDRTLGQVFLDGGTYVINVVPENGANKITDLNGVGLVKNTFPTGGDGRYTFAFTVQ